MLSPEKIRIEVQRNVADALAEDIGDGDLTARLIAPDSIAIGHVVTREDVVLCGRDWFDASFFALDAACGIKWFAQEGDQLLAGHILCEVTASARTLLTAERTALNFLQLLSGTATEVRRFVKAVEGTNAKIVDTRKTLPGLRVAQKYAVMVGGGTNHRVGLYDGVLIKENHIIAAGGIAQAMARAREIAPQNVFIEVEVENLIELREALDAGAKMILLDNMSLDEMVQAVSLTDGRAQLEASGGVDFNGLRAIAETGVDRISIGGLTKNVKAIDLSLRHVEQ